MKLAAIAAAALLAALPEPAAGQGFAPAPLSLRAAVAEALKGSPRLESADERVQEAEVQRRLAASRFGTRVVPSLTTGSDPALPGQRTYGVTAAHRFVTGTELQLSANSLQYGAGPDALRDNGYGFSVSQPMLRGFGPGPRADLTNARRAVAGAGRALAESRQDLVVAVVGAYVETIRQARVSEAAARAAERATTMRRATDARAKVGLATQLDLLRSDLLSAQAEATLEQATEARATALEDLNLLLGRAPDAPLAVVGDDVDDAALASSHLAPDTSDLPNGDATKVTDPAATEALVGVALGTRLDLQEAHDRVRDAERGIDVARWNLLPDVILSAGYTRRGLGAGASLFDQLFSGWRYAVTTSYPLDRSEATAAQANAQISLRAAERTATELQRRARAEVLRAHRAWLRTEQAIALQQKAAALAGRQLQLAHLRYERGLSGSLEVIDAENALFQAESALVGAQCDRATAGLRLKRALGRIDVDALARTEAP